MGQSTLNKFKFMALIFFLSMTQIRKVGLNQYPLNFFLTLKYIIFNIKVPKGITGINNHVELL